MHETAAVPAFPSSVFTFSGQAVLDPWTFTEAIRAMGWSRYDALLSQEPELFLHRVRDLVNDFPTWQNRRGTGRPAACEKIVLASLILRQYLRASYRQVESLLRIAKDFLGFASTYDANTLSRKNRSKRFAQILHRFHHWILNQHRAPFDIIATDATGYSRLKQSWAATNYQARGAGPWIKSNAAVAVPQMLYLNTTKAPGNVHDSQLFAATWHGLPTWVKPKRSLADAAYFGSECLAAARSRGATPIHAIKSNARWTKHPATDYQRMARFQRQFPNRSRQLRGQRALAETAFYCTKNRFGDQITSRTKTARHNEILCKEIGHNIRMLTMRQGITQRRL